jgi:hypothetical protein
MKINLASTFKYLLLLASVFFIEPSFASYCNDNVCQLAISHTTDNHIQCTIAKSTDMEITPSSLDLAAKQTGNFKFINPQPQAAAFDLNCNFFKTQGNESIGSCSAKGIKIQENGFALPTTSPECHLNIPMTMNLTIPENQTTTMSVFFK